MTSAPDPSDAPAVAETIAKVQRLLDTKGGVADLARLSGVPYTTLAEWKQKGIPRAIGTLAKLAPAIEQLSAASDGQAAA